MLQMSEYIGTGYGDEGGAENGKVSQLVSVTDLKKSPLNLLLNDTGRPVL
jgi:hypothetical protein